MRIQKLFIKLGLLILLIFFTFHLIKDTTQDILKIETPLDYLGNIQEDFTMLPPVFTTIFKFCGYLSFLAEIVTTYLLVRAIKGSLSALQKQILVTSLLSICLYFFIAYTLDPRVNLVFKRTSNISPIINNSQNSKSVLISTDNAVGARLFNLFTLEPDDALALTVLLNAHKQRKLNIIGITSSFGNTSGEASYKATKDLVDLSYTNIPVAKGAKYAGQEDSDAVEFIANKLRKSPDQVILVGLGPVTDYAAVFKKYPELITKVAYFLNVRSGPYKNKDTWYLHSFNAAMDLKSAEYIYKLGGNPYAMGEEIFEMTLTDQDVNDIQKNTSPFILYVSRDLKLWNLENKVLPNKGYIKRGGNMCPWDLVWSMYLVYPELFKIHTENNYTTLHIKNIYQFKKASINELKSWE